MPQFNETPQQQGIWLVSLFVSVLLAFTLAGCEGDEGTMKSCEDCHGEGLIDWTELGWTDDLALGGGTRP